MPTPVKNTEVSTVPTADVIALPVTSIVIGNVPVAEVKPRPVSERLESPLIAGSPIEEVNPIPETDII